MGREGDILSRIYRLERQAFHLRDGLEIIAILDVAEGDKELYDRLYRLAALAKKIEAELDDILYSAR